MTGLGAMSEECYSPTFSTFLSIIFHVKSCLEEKEIFFFFLEYDSLKPFNIVQFACPYTGASEAAHVNNCLSG